MIATPTISELHTSDLTEPCARRVQLRLAGKTIGEYPTAMFRGSLFHAAVRALHQHTQGLAVWQRTFAEAAVLVATKTVQEEAATDRRTITPAVVNALPTIQAEIVNLILNYGARLAPVVNAGRFIGCELPIRWSIDVDGEPANFASHLDLLWRAGDGRLHVWDWKTGEDAPTYAYLSRNMQLGLYWLMVRYGSVQVDGEWIDFGAFPSVAWVHVNALAPYGRKTTGKGDDGQERTFEKGEHRPLARVLMPCGFMEEQEAALLEELAVRVRMFRAGLFPTNPDPVGCHICPSVRWCPSFRGGSDE